MGGVSSTNHMPRGTSSCPTATQSDSASTDVQPEVTQMPKPEVARKPVIIQQPPTLAPFSQIRADGGILFPSSDQSHKGTDNRPTVVLYLPKEGHQSIPTRTGNTDNHDVTRRLVKVKCYICSFTFVIWQSKFLLEW